MSHLLCAFRSTRPALSGRSQRRRPSGIRDKPALLLDLLCEPNSNCVGVKNIGVTLWVTHCTATVCSLFDSQLAKKCCAGTMQMTRISCSSLMATTATIRECELCTEYAIRIEMKINSTH